MKPIFTLLTALCLSLFGHSQIILNEWYAIPGNNRQEFFELYNNSTATTPVSMDDFTIVTYFEESASVKGFYVMDLPNLFVGPRGYFVGSAALPFNYQGVTNSSNSNYSWNDLAFMAANNGSLKKWVLGTTVPAATDGNSEYDLATLPANFNDFFNKINGGGASYSVFVYEDGLLHSAVFAGVGGASVVPSYITAMPALFVNMGGSSTDFTIGFPGYATIPAEYVGAEAGTDNGYIRTSDGLCGSWTKSSADAFHTPGFTNGVPDGTTGVISVSSAITKGTGQTGSIINYDVVGGPITSFPVTMQVYLDNGSIPGRIDPDDTFLITQTEQTVADGPYSTTFFPWNSNILIVVNTNAGCIDHIIYIPNTGVLAPGFIRFEARKQSAETELNWTIAENETVQSFEVQSSTNGTPFRTAGYVLPNTTEGFASYRFTDNNPAQKLFYRIKCTGKNGKVYYSGIQSVGSAENAAGMLKLTNNPVASNLNISYTAIGQGPAQLHIFDAAGARVQQQKVYLTPGKNTLSINLEERICPGLYIVEITTDSHKESKRFIKL